MAALYHIYTCHFLWFTPDVESSRIPLLDLHHFLSDDYNMAALYHIYIHVIFYGSPQMLEVPRISLLDLHHFLLDDDMP
jgi:hypothetical protein